MADVTLRLAAAGGQATKREVDAVRESARRLGYDVQSTAAQSTSALGRMGTGIERLARQGQNLAAINPVLGSVVGSVGTLGSRLTDVEHTASFLGGSLGDKVALGANAATAGLLTLGAVGVGSFLSLTTQVRTFQRVSGATAEDASKLVFVAHELNIDTDLVAKGFYRLSRAVIDTKNPLAAYGVVTAHTKNGTADLLGTLGNLSDAYNRLPDQASRNALANAAFGRSGIELEKVLGRGREGVKELADEAQRLGLVMNQGQVDQGKRLSLVLREIEAGGKGLAIGIGEGAVPAITTLTSAIVPALEFLNRFHVLTIGLEGLLAGKLAQGFVTVAARMVRSTEAAIGQASAIKALVTAENAEAAAAARAALAERGRTGAAAGTAGAGAAVGGEAAAEAGGLAATIGAAEGPIGLAVGGLGLLAGVVQLFTHNAHDAAVSGKEFADAIAQDGSAAGDATKQLLAHAVAQHGLRSEMQQTGVTTSELIRAVMGSNAQFEVTKEKLRELIRAQGGNADTAAKLSDEITNLRHNYRQGSTDAAALAAAQGDLGVSTDAVAASAVQAASDVDLFTRSLSNFDAVRESASATRSYAEEVRKLQALQSPFATGEAEHAARVDALTRANQDAARATRARQDAERQYNEVASENVALLQHQADLTARQADVSARTAARDATKAAAHVGALQAAGIGGQTLATARDEAERLGLAAEQARDDATKAHQTASQVAADHESRLADAADRVTQAKDAERAATDKVTKAYLDAQVPAAQLGTTTADIADQLDRVVAAAEKDWGDKLAAGMVTSDQAAAGLFTSLMNLRAIATDPALQAALDAVINATPFERKAERGALPGQAYRHAAGGYAVGGWALVGEQGPELVRLSRGDRVYPAGQTRGMLSAGVPAFAGGGTYGDNGMVRRSGGTVVIHERVQVVTIPQKLVGTELSGGVQVNGDEHDFERWARTKGVIPKFKAGG